MMLPKPSSYFKVHAREHVSKPPLDIPMAMLSCAVFLIHNVSLGRRGIDALSHTGRHMFRQQSGKTAEDALGIVGAVVGSSLADGLLAMKDAPYPSLHTLKRSITKGAATSAVFLAVHEATSVGLHRNPLCPGASQRPLTIQEAGISAMACAVAIVTSFHIHPKDKIHVGAAICAGSLLRHAGKKDITFPKNHVGRMTEKAFQSVSNVFI